MMKNKIIIFLVIAISCSPKETYYSNLTKLWDSDFNINPRSIIIHNEAVYCHTPQTVMKLNLDDGTKEWEHLNPGNYLNSKPLISNDKVYFAGRNILQSIDYEGKIEWEINTNSKTFGIIQYGNLIVNCRTNQGIFANELSTGKEVWSITPTHQMLSPTEPTISENKLYIGNLGYGKDSIGRFLSCYDLLTQTELWTYNDVSCDTYGTPTTDSSFVYLNVLTPYKDGYTVKLNKNTGKLIWKIKTEPESVIDPLLKDSLIYISSYRNGVIALNKEDGMMEYNSNDEVNQSHTELVDNNNFILYGNQNRELLSITNNDKQKVISKFEYGIGNPIEYKNDFYIMDGNGTMFKISSY